MSNSGETSRRCPSFKVVLVGEVGVGKTSLFMRVKDNEFGCRPKVGVESCVRDYYINDTRVSIHLWDTAGSERFRTLTSNYYRNCHAVFFVYALDNEASFSALPKWITDVEQYASSDVIRVVVGNKCDLPAQVKPSVVEEFADLYQCQILSTVSAKSGHGIDELCEALCEFILMDQNVDRMSQPNTYRVSFTASARGSTRTFPLETTELKDNNSSGCSC